MLPCQGGSSTVPCHDMLHRHDEFERFLEETEVVSVVVQDVEAVDAGEEMLNSRSSRFDAVVYELATFFLPCQQPAQVLGLRLIWVL